MTQDIFWSTIAQIAATFAGLTFIGYEIHAGNVKDAVNGLESKVCELRHCMTEVMLIVFSTTMIWYMLALVLAVIEIIFQSTTLSIFTSLLVIIAVAQLLFILYIVTNRTRDKLKMLSSSSGGLARKRVVGRVLRQLKLTWCIVAFPMLIAVSSLLLYHDVIPGVLHLSQSMLASLTESANRVVALASLMGGLIFTMIGIATLGVDNTLFEARDIHMKLQDFNKQLSKRLKRIDDTLRLAERELSKGSRSISGKDETVKMQQWLGDLRDGHKKFREHIPELCDCKDVEEIIQKGDIVSFAEIHGHVLGLSSLSNGVELLDAEASRLWMTLRSKPLTGEGTGTAIPSEVWHDIAHPSDPCASLHPEVTPAQYYDRVMTEV